VIVRRSLKWWIIPEPNVKNTLQIIPGISIFSIAYSYYVLAWSHQIIGNHCSYIPWCRHATWYTYRTISKLGCAPLSGNPFISVASITQKSIIYLFFLYFLFCECLVQRKRLQRMESILLWSNNSLRNGIQTGTCYPGSKLRKMVIFVTNGSSTIITYSYVTEEYFIWIEF